MKLLNNLAFVGMAAAMVSAAYSQDAAKPEAPAPKAVNVVGDFFPEGTLVEGKIVMVQFDEELPNYLKKFDESAAKLSKEEQEELRKTLKPGQPIPFDAKFGLTKEEYDKYIECWNKRKIVEVAPVVFGMMKSSDANVWTVASSTQSGPMPFSTLKYDGNKGVWVSPNGTLERKPDIVYDELNNLGAWTAHEWLLEDKTAFSHTAENILLGKTKDGKSFYVIYNYLEVTTQGSVVDNKTVVLRFSVDVAKADKAKPSAGSGHSL